MVKYEMVGVFVLIKEHSPDVGEMQKCGDEVETCHGKHLVVTLEYSFLHSKRSAVCRQPDDDADSCTVVEVVVNVADCGVVIRMQSSD